MLWVNACLSVCDWWFYLDHRFTLCLILVSIMTSPPSSLNASVLRLVHFLQAVTVCSWILVYMLHLSVDANGRGLHICTAVISHQADRGQMHLSKCKYMQCSEMGQILWRVPKLLPCLGRIRVIRLIYCGILIPLEKNTVKILYTVL